jgi:UDP-glucuronate 4-epimerase
MKRILVTGAAGFIGSSLCDALLERGDTLLGLDNFNDYYAPAIKHRNLAGAQEHENFTLVEGDITDEGTVRKAFDDFQPEVVVHLAARAGVRPSLADPALYNRVNVMGSQNILEACRTADLSHLVFASTSSVYGGSTDVPFSEDNPVMKPISPYAATKRANELMAHVYSHVHGLNVSLMRFFTVYGPRQRPDMAIHKFTRMIDAGDPIPMFGDGSTARDYTYIDDIVHGLIQAVDRPFRYEIFNLGEHHTTTLRELITLIEKHVGKEAVIDQQPMQPGDVTITFADIDKARTLLDYDPQTDMDTGIQNFVQWYREVNRP